MSELLRWAQSLHDEPHHNRCSVKDGGECDCYRTTRSEYGMADEALTMNDRERSLAGLVDALRPLVIRCADAQDVCDGYVERAEWEACPGEAIQESLDADRALILWARENATFFLGGEIRG